MMVGDMEVPLRRRGGYAVTKGLMALALVGGCVLAFVPWGSHAASPAIAAAHAAAAPAKLTRETASKKWGEDDAATDAPPASPAPPPLPPLIPVGNPFDMCPPYAPALGFAVRWLRLPIPRSSMPGLIGRFVLSRDRARRAASSFRTSAPPTAPAKLRRASPSSASSDPSSCSRTSCPS